MLIVVFFTGIVNGTFAQNNPDPAQKIAPELLQQDYRLFRDTLQKLHAGLYRYQSKKKLDKLFNKDSIQIDRPLSKIAFFNIIKGMISNIEDGHSDAFLPDDANRYLLEHAKLFPMQLRMAGDRAYVVCQTKEFSAGTQILSIDGQTIRKIRENFFAHLPSDGSILTGKYNAINEGHDSFFYLYYILYGEKPFFLITYKTPNGKKGTTKLNAVTPDALECLPSKDKPSHYLTLEYKPGNIAVLTVRTFLNAFLKDTHENFKAFMALSFKELNEKNVSKLIVDIRDNKGGDDGNGALLYAYLTAEPFHYFESKASTTKKGESHELDLQQPQENNFTGKVEFLISGKTFSSAADFAAIARSNKRGIFIGEETGGGYYGNTSGARATVILPNTHIRVNIPLDKYVNAVIKTKYKDRGTIPDYIIVPDIKDILENRDTQLNYALQVAAQ
ncbi:S41 family peptidase [Chitinophagaceae bacterium LWZ2-11]